MSDITDVNLYKSGEQKIEWVKNHCDLLKQLEVEFTKTQPFKNLKVALSVHLEAKTAYLCKVLQAGGAKMYVTGSNPLSTQDDIAAALVHCGMEVFAHHGASPEQYEKDIEEVIKIGPNIIIDDGGDLVTLIHTKYPELIPNVIGGCEETTTGILRLEQMNKADKLAFPMIKVNNAKMKHFFDNRYGTGQSVWDGINRTTNLVVAGKTAVVAGYGWCGKGVAMRAKGLGAKVIVTEVDPVKAIEAIMDGFDVMPMDEASWLGDIFVTVTGCCDVITEHHFMRMKDGAILCNAGHFDCEVNVGLLRAIADDVFEARQNVTGYKLRTGRTVYVLGEGRLVNLACGDGHPAEIMDMSFAIQALSAEFLVKHKEGPMGLLMDVPDEIDTRVAKLKLCALNKSIDTLTYKQHKYLYGV